MSVWAVRTEGAGGGGVAPSKNGGMGVDVAMGVG
jgi:hypothetical protein